MGSQPTATTSTLINASSPKAFSAVFISRTVRGGGKYIGGVLAPTGDVIFVPCNAKCVGVFPIEHLPGVLPKVPLSWHVLL